MPKSMSGCITDVVFSAKGRSEVVRGIRAISVDLVVLVVLSSEISGFGESDGELKARYIP